jgi:hypothetical protein
MTDSMKSEWVRYEVLINYLLVKVQEKDWHGVSDAANDIRVMEAEHPELKTIPLTSPGNK